MEASSLLTWQGSNAQKLATIDQSLNRIIVLEGMIHAPISSKDQINRITYNGNQLILHNLKIYNPDKLLIAIDELKLDMGKIYAITGERGSGKTSLLSKIKGIKENGISGKGDIYYPKIDNDYLKIAVVSQRDYFPLNSSLQEVLYYPDKIPSDFKLNKYQRTNMLMLLRELGLEDDFTLKKLYLDTVGNWNEILSGGMKKEVLVISAIIKKPHILILDEIFSNLDTKSIKIVQRLLKEQLPDSLILVVDHDAITHNYNNFYDGNLLLTDKRVILQALC